MDSATLLYAPSLSANQGDEAVTQHFYGGARAEVDDGREAQGAFAMTGHAASEADDTQLFATPPTEIKEMTSTAPGARETQAVEDVDRTLRFSQSTELRVIAGHTVSASATAQGAGLTRVGAIMGTPTYMSPEQCRSAHLDARSDIYSLGVIAYQMLAGEPPFKGDTSTVMRDHLETTPPPLRERTKKVSKGAAGILMSALAKDPADRPQTALAFANSLRAQADGIGSLYRRAFALYSEHFPKFLRLSLIAHIPVIVFTFLLIGLTLCRKVFDQPWKGSEDPDALCRCVGGFGASSGCRSGCECYLGNDRADRHAIVGSAVAPGAVAYSVRCGETTLAAILEYQYSSLDTHHDRLRAVYYSRHRHVSAVRAVGAGGSDGRAVEESCAEARARAGLAILAHGYHHLGAPGFDPYHGERAARQGVLQKVDKSAAPTHGVNVSAKVSRQVTTKELAGLINILIVPLMSIVPALLYLKMRQLGGETLVSALEEIEEGDSRRSQWQKRMRSRLTVTPASGQTSRATPRSGG